MFVLHNKVGHWQTRLKLFLSLRQGFQEIYNILVPAFQDLLYIDKNMYRKKIFYNTETNSATFCKIQQMSFKSTFLSM